MTTSITNTGYEALSAGILAAFFAQVIKFFIFTIKAKKVNFKIFTTTGGMPSSHSAGVMGLATSVGIIEGFGSVFFAIAIGFALITMYDAAGVRRAAGKTAACLNRMMDDFRRKIKRTFRAYPFRSYYGRTFWDSIFILLPLLLFIGIIKICK